MRITKSTLMRELVPAIRDAAHEEIARQLNARNVPSSTQWGSAFMRAIDEERQHMSNLNTDRSLDVGRFLRAFAAAGGDQQKAVDFARREYGATARVVKALGSDEFTAGGALIPQDLVADVIDRLRPLSVVRQMSPTMVSSNRGSIDFPRITASASAGYVSENTDIPSSRLTTGLLALSAKKLAGLTAVSNELLGSGVDSDAIVTADLVKVLGTVEDQNFIRGDGLENTPRGLRYWAAPANVTGSAGTSEANIETDLKDLMNALTSQDVPMTRPYFIMNPRRFNHLLILRDANGNLVYPELRTPNPTILTIPVLRTNNVPHNLGVGGNESEIYCVDASEVILAEVPGLKLATSPDATYLDETGNLVSAFSRDQTVIRVTMLHDLGVKHAESVAVKTAVTWGG